MDIYSEDICEYIQNVKILELCKNKHSLTNLKMGTIDQNVWNLSLPTKIVYIW